MRCGERQDRWYICENHAEWRTCLVLLWRLSRSVALTSACCLPSLLLDTLWCHVLCVCSQRCRFMCDGLHNILYIGSSRKDIRIVLHAFVTHFLSCCHIDLGRGDLFFEKLGVRTTVACKQSPHLLLPLTSFGPQGHKIPAEIQPRIIVDRLNIRPSTT